MIYRTKEEAIKAESEILNQIENLEADLDIAMFKHGIDSVQVEKIEDDLQIARLQANHASIEVQKHMQG